MTLRIAIAMVSCLVVGTGLAFASQEVIIPWSSFTIESRVLPSGVVEISGAQSESGISRLIVKAFGRRYELGEAQLRELEGMTVNGMDLTYTNAPGPFSPLRRPTLYLLFRRGVVEQEVSVSEEDGVKVGSRKSAKPPPNKRMHQSGH